MKAKRREALACPVDPYCLGMCSWTNRPRSASVVILEPHPKRDLQLLPSSRTEPHPSSSPKRFALASHEELAKLAEGLVPENTSKTINWALKNFNQWMATRKQSCPNDPAPDFLQTTDPQTLNIHLARFIVETRKSNGDLYPPTTVHQLLCGFLRHMRSKNPGCPNFLDKKDSRFRQLHGTLDSYFHKLHSEGVGRQTIHVQVISSEEEDQLWEKGVMGTKTPTQLQNAAFFVVEKMFCLRGGQEHRGLQLSQLKRFEDKFVYYVSKNRNGSFKQLRVKNKTVPLYPTPEAGEHCPVHILDRYTSKLPAEVREKKLFYVRPLDKVTSNPDMPWYSSVPLGKHTLQSKLKNMCQKLESVVTKRTTAYVQLLQLRCSDKVLLKSLFKSEQVIVLWKHRAHTNGWMKCSIRQYHLYSQMPQESHAL